MKATKKYEFNPDYAIPPGETLKEIMEYMEISQSELSEITGLTARSLNKIIKGKQAITYETANILELATNVPAKMWNKLEANYRKQLAKAKEPECSEERLIWLQEMPAV